MSYRFGSMTTWVGLLRGINVGGGNKLLMADLRALYEGLGARNVVTYIQSGNVCFESDVDDEAELTATVAAAIESETGLTVPVMHRRAAEIVAVVEALPFEDDNPKQLAIASLGAEPEASAWDNLDPDRSPPDRFAAGDRAVYVHAPNGFAKTKLTNDYIEKQLGVTSTTRNIRTMRKLVDLVTQPPFANP